MLALVAVAIPVGVSVGATTTRVAATAPAALSVVVMRFGSIWIGGRLERNLAVAVPLIEIAGGEIGRAPVTCARLARLLVGSVTAQILSHATGAARELTPATLRRNRSGACWL